VRVREEEQDAGKGQGAQPAWRQEGGCSNWNSFLARPLDDETVNTFHPTAHCYYYPLIVHLLGPRPIDLSRERVRTRPKQQLPSSSRHHQ
jgi:hypothetical protein